MEDSSALLLRPFNHQVGGHFLVLEINKDLICKPLVSREKLFYDTIPKDLKEFAPQYHGDILVQFTKDDKGEVQYIAYPNNGHPRPLAPSKTVSEASVGITVSEEEELERLQVLKCSMRNDPTRTKCHEIPFTPSDGSGFPSPWTQVRLGVFSKGLEKQESEMHEYIVLENLTGKYRCPCILDLKVGTRSYTDVMSPGKRQEHMDRSASTTSLKLGIRLGGMHVYNTFKKSYHCYAKYYGNGFSEQALFDTLKMFVFNGQTHRLDITQEITKKLTKLRSIISKLNTYRFFSSSLLILYEGEEDTNPPNQDTGVSEYQDNVPTLTANPDSINSTPATQILDSKPPLVDVRMIDFANLTHSGFVNDPVTYDGPDEGYMLGLSTLIKLYESI